MSVPGRIGIILIVILAIVDGIILLGGAHRAATATQTSALAFATVAVKTDKSDTLLADAMHEIDLLRIRAMGSVSPRGI